MRPQDLIEKKRDRIELTHDEIAFLIRGYTQDEIPDYQMAAWLMAVFLNGMTESETLSLVDEMLHSGVVLTHPEILLPKVDKHSTGGVGDKTSLVVAPVGAECGLAVPMISGRALSHTGGTLDKLESIPGFKTNLSLPHFRDVLKHCGLALIGQTREIAPADRKLYALRDLTGTVQSRPLICASIMSKKIAEGIDGLVFDVKVGNGAFMREIEDARKLARMLISVGKRMGKTVIALITQMNQPLGRWVGNAVETKEAIETLKGQTQGDFAELSIELAAQMIIAGGITADIAVARASVMDAIISGRALERFRMVIEAQGGDPKVIEQPDRMGRARHERDITAERSGVISNVDTAQIGHLVMEWGGGRKRLGDPIDHAVGFEIHAKPGQRITAGEPLVTAHFNNEGRFDEMQSRVRHAYAIGDHEVVPGPLILEVLNDA